MTSLIDNFDYNVKCNVNTLNLSDDSSHDEKENGEINQTINKPFFKNPLWSTVYSNQQMVEKQIEDEENDIISPQPLIDYPTQDLFEAEKNLGQQHSKQYSNNTQLEEEKNDQTNQSQPSQPLTILTPSLNAFTPNTCLNHTESCGCIGYTPPVGYNSMTIDTNHREILQHRQDCLNNMQNSTQSILLDWINFTKLPQNLQNDIKCDIILGSELCYPTILSELPSLSTIINSTLSEHGAFYLVQSPNRGTSHHFIEQFCSKYDFLLDLRAVNLDILAPFSSHQRPEDYVYYTFRRRGSMYPIMGYENDIVAPPRGLSQHAADNINIDKFKFDKKTEQICEAGIISFNTALLAEDISSSTTQNTVQSEIEKSKINHSTEQVVVLISKDEQNGVPSTHIE
jgi:hypothetical protein